MSDIAIDKVFELDEAGMEFKIEKVTKFALEQSKLTNYWKKNCLKIIWKEQVIITNEQCTLFQILMVL